MTRYMVLAVGARRLAVPLDMVIRALPAAALSPEGRCGTVAGTLKVGSQVIPVADPRGPMEQDAKEMKTSDAIVLVTTDRGTVGLWVDQVEGIFEPLSQAQSLGGLVIQYGHERDQMATVLNPGDLLG